MLDETEVSFLKKVQAVKFGYWTLLPKEQIIDDGATKRNLEPLVFNILLYFILNNDRIITRKNLIDDVWKQNYVDDNAINRAISELRKALKSEKQIGHVVKTHYRTGYSFILPIELIYYQPKPAVELESALKEEVESKTIKVGFITQYLTSNSNKPRYLYSSFVAVFMTLVIGSYYFMTQPLVIPVRSHSAVTPPLEFSEEILSWEKGAIDVPKMSKNNKYLAYSYRTSKNNEFASIIRDEKWLNWRLMECPYKKDIYFFEYKNNFAIVHIFYQYVKRLNILYTYSTDKLQENELYVQIMNWAINNDIDLVWAINRNTELKNIFPTIFDKPLKFAAWSLDEKILKILQNGLLDLQGIDTDTDSCLYVD